MHCLLPLLFCGLALCSSGPVAKFDLRAAQTVWNVGSLIEFGDFEEMTSMFESGDFEEMALFCQSTKFKLRCMKDLKSYLADDPQRFHTVEVPLVLELAKRGMFFFQIPFHESKKSFLFHPERFTGQQALDLVLVLQPNEMARFIQLFPQMLAQAIAQGPDAIKVHLQGHRNLFWMISFTWDGYCLMHGGDEKKFSEEIREFLDDEIMTKEIMPLVCSYPRNFQMAFNRETSLQVIKALPRIFYGSPHFLCDNADLKGICAFFESTVLSEEEILDLVCAYGKFWSFLSKAIKLKPRHLRAIIEVVPVIEFTKLKEILSGPLSHYFLGMIKMGDFPGRHIVYQYLSDMPYPAFVAIALFHPDETINWILWESRIIERPDFLLEYFQSMPALYLHKFQLKKISEKSYFDQDIIEAGGDLQVFIRKQLESSKNPRFFFAFARCADDPAVGEAFFARAIEMNRWDYATAVGHSIILNGASLDLMVFLDNSQYQALEELVFVHRIPFEFFLDISLTLAQLSAFDRIYGPCLCLDSLRTTAGLILLKFASTSETAVLRVFTFAGQWSSLRILHGLEHGLPSLQ